MKDKLIKLAIISSPILAFYGVAPVYIFYKMEVLQIVFASVALTFIIFIFWLMNIYVLKIVKNAIQRYALSYALIILWHFITMFLEPHLIFQADLGIFMAHRFISILAINTIILFIINSISLQYEKNIAEVEIRNLKVSNLEAQKQALLQQLQPHFLFNALSTLKSLIKENPEEGENYVLKLSEFLRYSVQAHANELVSLNEELRFTQDYLDLQKVRFGEALQCNIAIPDEVLAKKIPVYALQTLVENAIKHNAFTEKKPLIIRITWENKRLKVSNNKQAKQLINPSGTGLLNLQKRYQLVANHEVEIINQENDFTVFLYLL